jgi:hypothetical protein
MKGSKKAKSTNNEKEMRFLEATPECASLLVCSALFVTKTAKQRNSGIHCVEMISRAGDQRY